MNTMKPSKYWRISAAINIALLTSLLAGTPGGVNAKDLGRVGRVYTIVETTLCGNRETAHERPPQNNRIALPATTRAGEQFLDLSYIVPRDISDAEGNVLFSKGYRFNPLQHRRFRTMIVINGADQRQAQWAAGLEASADVMTRIVITEGEKANLAGRFRQSVYYLHPQVAERYRITSVPTIIRQKGDYLEVAAIHID